MTLRVWSIGLACLLFGCASAPDAPRSLAGPLMTPAALRAKRSAPDLYVRAARARHEADGLHGPAAQAMRRRSALWLQAAILESQRLAHAEAQAKLAVRARRMRARVAELDAELRSVQEKLRFRKQRAQAHADARHLHTAVWGSARVARRGSASAASKGQTQRLAKLLLDRAKLTLVAARLGAADDADARASLEQAQAAIVASEQRSGVDIVAAERALVAAQSALGTQRAARPAPDAGERRSLLAEAAERGVAVRIDPQAVSLEVPEATFVSGARPSERGLLTLRHLDELLRLHPHGPVQIELRVPSTRRWPLASPQLWARARRVARALRAHRRRVRIARPVGNSAAPPALWIALPAYAAP